MVHHRSRKRYEGLFAEALPAFPCILHALLLTSGESSVHCRWGDATRERQHVATTTAMWIHVSLALLLQAAPRLEPQFGASTPSITSVAEAANNAVIEFLATWRNAWHSSVPRGGDGDGIRLRDVHCHWDGSFQGSSTRKYPPSVIHHGSRRSMCPNWFPTSEFSQSGERVERDGSLAPGWRDPVRQARSMLIDSLYVLDQRKPGDNWITGQRVRFL